MSKIATIPIYDMYNIPQALRTMANEIENGETDAIRCVLVLEDSDGGMDYRAFGAEPFTVAHAAGLCLIAATNTIVRE